MTTQFLRKFLDAAPGEGGAGDPLPPSLTDITDPNYNPTGGQLDAAAQKQAEEEAAALAAQTTLEKEAKNEDGTLKEGYIEVEGKITKDPNFKPAEGSDLPPEDDDDPAAFWADVDKLHGATVEVNYPEGVDPLSPEGVYHREKVVASNAVANWEIDLQQRDPRGYAYMLHRQAGGDDESFFANKSLTLPDYTEFRNSAEEQTRIYRNALLQKGLDGDTVQMIVDKAIKDGQLTTKADIVYKEIEAAQANELAAIQARQAAAQQEYMQSVTALDQRLTTTIVDGKDMKFLIPDTDKQEFIKFVRERVEHDPTQRAFVLVNKIGDDLPRQLEALYLLYKKGDLSGLVKREAQTQVVRKLHRQIDKSKDGTKTPAGDEGGNSGGVKFVTLGEIGN